MSGLSESFEVDGLVLYVSRPVQEYFILKTPSVRKCQAEYPADTKQVGGDFRRQPATFDNPAMC